MELLVADDDHASRLYLELALVSLRHTVAVVENGAEALELLDQFLFDAVLLDVEMPVMGGLEAWGRVRANPAFQDLRVYAITSHAGGPSLEAIQQASFSGYLAKPYGPRELAQLLSEERSPLRHPFNPELRLVDREAFAEYQELLRDAGMSPAAAVKRTLEAVASWLAGQPECLLGGREQVHELTGSCAVIGATALREAMKNLERFLMNGDAGRWPGALADVQTILQDTKRSYGELLSIVDPGQQS
jgi:CheY-like chemotaxis protein